MFEVLCTFVLNVQIQKCNGILISKGLHLKTFIKDDTNAQWFDQ